MGRDNVVFEPWHKSILPVICIFHDNIDMPYRNSCIQMCTLQEGKKSLVWIFPSTFKMPEKARRYDMGAVSYLPVTFLFSQVTYAYSQMNDGLILLYIKMHVNIHANYPHTIATSSRLLYALSYDVLSALIQEAYLSA